jgi:hypothetical protein
MINFLMHNRKPDRPATQRWACFDQRAGLPLRNAVIALLRHGGHTNVAATIRHNAWCSYAALHVLGLQP